MNANESMLPLKELKRRKLVQWAVAYLAGARVALQLLDVVAERTVQTAGPRYV